LDPETKKQLNRWERMMELLKQWVYSPISVPKQVCSIFAWARWYLDDITIDKVRKFENDLYNALEEEKTILESITKEKQLTDNSEDKLKELILKIVEIYK
jgi:F-type H+-transporting ATPase subunit alpha